MLRNRRPLPRFEFDERKSCISMLKHGIDFVEAQALWLDDNLDEYRVEHAVEARFLVIGRIAAKYWVAVVTHRGDRVRLISVRRASSKEIERHES